MSQPILQIQDLHTHFFTDRGEIPAVDGVSLYVRPGRSSLELLANQAAARVSQRFRY
ncbi:ABC transporter ATP-binding protein [Paenibacillus vortex V453]|uniref:ABC transporter ATP-binding protein n=1 Tax=Paenibacillus vortex V453 TaxID=715225 RepID=A0A2R9SV24_9BACL|nr:ABC transporter ATP-binding protein [Paenibacillus vortex V453]